MTDPAATFGTEGAAAKTSARTLYRVDGATAWITFNRPDELNAFRREDYAELRRLIRLSELDDRVDIIVINGVGRAFATGGNLKHFLRYFEPEFDAEAYYDFIDALPFEALRITSKTVIAAVDGICVAGGMIVALLADVIVASETASFGAPEGRVGLTDPWIPALLLHRIGVGRTRELLLTGRNISASEAAAIGLIDRLVPSGRLAESISDVMAEIRETLPAARTQYKHYLTELMPMPPLANPIAHAVDTLERLRAFASRNGSGPGHTRSPSGEAP